MSISDMPSEGGKKRNRPFQKKNLVGLAAIAKNTEGTTGILSAILSAVKAHQDMELLLVRDTGNDQIVQQINEYDEESDTWSVSYKDATGADYTLIGAPEYQDAAAVLNLILTELLDQGVTLDDIELNTDDVATETTLAGLDAYIQGFDFSTEVTLAAVLADTTAILALDFATETTLSSIDTRLTPAVRTHNTVVANAAGSVPAGSMRGSMINSGNASGTWNGASIPAGVSVPWGPIGNRDTYGAISYDASGTTFVIEYTT
jgi:hypothetical protein